MHARGMGLSKTNASLPFGVPFHRSLKRARTKDAAEPHSVRVTQLGFKANPVTTNSRAPRPSRPQIPPDAIRIANFNL